MKGDVVAREEAEEAARVWVGRKRVRDLKVKENCSTLPKAS